MCPTPSALAPEHRLLQGDIVPLIGLLLVLLGAGMLGWGVLALRDGERRTGLRFTVLGTVVFAVGLWMSGVF